MSLRTTCFFLFAAILCADEFPYQKAPKAISDVLNAPTTPNLSLSPARTHAILVQTLRYPPISEVGAPMLRLAGLRIDPKTNGPHLPTVATKLTLKRLSDGVETVIALPAGAKPSTPRWSPDGSLFAFTNTAFDRVELWIGATATGKARKIEGVRLNTAVSTGRFGPDAFAWVDDNHTMLLHTVSADRGAPPTAPEVYRGPHVQESEGRAGPVRTNEDMLANPHDEAVFEYYATSQLAFLDVPTGKTTLVGKPGIFLSTQMSPDGKHVLTVRAHRPFSYLHPVGEFPKDIEIWDRSGKVERVIAKLPLADRVPIEGVQPGPRAYSWRPSAPATIIWTEALDGGNPREQVPFRDKLVTLSAPFQGEPAELTKTENRMQRVEMGEDTGLALVSDYERRKRWVRTFAIDMDKPGQERMLLWERNQQDQYKDPGTPVTKQGRRGGIVQDGDSIYLAGKGASPEGERPFLDKYNTKTRKAERLYQSDAKSYEVFEGLLDDQASRFVTVKESPTEPPNYYVRSADGKMSAITKIPDPTPQLRSIEKRLVKYKRPDGVDLSFTLYLPPGYKAGTRLPTVVWAYPREYNDADTAGQIGGSTQRFTTISGMSHLFYLLAGYAVLDNAGMPVVGDPETVNNTYIEQITADAKAAIDKAVELGVTDRDRVGVGGHSYGAFMTGNLLAHTDLFRAGVARSGAYNRTLTPFGFQSERRTIWEASDIYLKMSPFMYANKVNEPLLLIHGEADNNQGTFPIQSERMYAAVRGHGGKVRLVMLPAESHGYQARESIEHTLWEMITWFDKYVKNAGSLTSSAAR